MWKKDLPMSQNIPTPDNGPQRPLSDAERLDLYIAAEKAILTGHQSYSVDGMTFTRADLFRVQQMIAGLRQSVAQSGTARPTLGGIVTTQVVF